MRFEHFVWEAPPLGEFREAVGYGLFQKNIFKLVVNEQNHQMTPLPIQVDSVTHLILGYHKGVSLLVLVMDDGCHVYQLDTCNKVNDSLFTFDVLVRPSTFWAWKSLESTPPAWFYTIDQDQVFGWFWGNDLAKCSILSLTSKPTLMSASALGTLALFFSEQGTLELFNGGAKILSYRKRASFKVDTIKSMDWFVTPSGFELLAVASTNQVTVYSKFRQHGKSEWIQINQKTLDESVLKIFWLSNGCLMVISSFSVTILMPESTGMIMMEKLMQGNGRLSDLHPDLLNHYIIAGRYELAQFNLSLLSIFSKLIPEQSIVEIPTALWSLVGVDVGQGEKDVDYDSLFSYGENEGTEKLGKLTPGQVDDICARLPQMKVFSLTDEQKLQLESFTKSFLEIGQYTTTIDANGLRYLFPANLTLDLVKKLPDSVCCSRDICWAFFSESQDILLDILTKSEPKMNWANARVLGMGYWIQNLEVLVILFKLETHCRTNRKKSIFGSRRIQGSYGVLFVLLGHEKEECLVGTLAISFIPS